MLLLPLAPLSSPPAPPPLSPDTLSTDALSSGRRRTMFNDIVHLQNLFSSGWPATTITDAAAADGNQGGAWNYGESAINQFGGSTTSFADHSVMGSFGVTDTAYSGEASYAAGIASMNSVINVDPGTAASTAGHGIPGATAGI
ncbi:hypothetical protein T484DRAFT_1911830 [Baffinella frigidus]|nr:hypothetical protein T484DRAFT_1911830 [Cryptophyta sp. CCMP2293]